MKTVLNHIGVIALTLVCLYIVLAPWLSIMDISKSINNVADRLDELKAELHDIDKEIRVIRLDEEKRGKQRSDSNP